MSVRVKRISLSNGQEKTAEGEKLWRDFETESFESAPLPKKNDKEIFVSLQEVGKSKDEEFIGLEETGGIYEKRKEAEDILQKAQERVSLLEREAYEKGFAQGEKDGIELGEKKAIKVTENIENLFTELGRLKKEMIRQYEREILEVIFAIARKIIRRQLKSDEKAVRETILEAVHLATKKSEIILRVNPEDFDFVERLRPELFTEFKELKSITVTSDPSIARGGCFIETPYGDVDARIETQLEKIYHSLEGAFAEEKDD